MNERSIWARREGDLGSIEFSSVGLVFWDWVRLGFLGIVLTSFRARPGLEAGGLGCALVWDDGVLGIWRVAMTVLGRVTWMRLISCLRRSLDINSVVRPDHDIRGLLLSTAHANLHRGRRLPVTRITLIKIR